MNYVRNIAEVELSSANVVLQEITFDHVAVVSVGLSVHAAFTFWSSFLESSNLPDSLDLSNLIHLVDTFH